ncbi:uncharacterized protein LOC123623416 [Lemur catta]|uniref:uncharacterized protein LOC123623416 n=1 Tax=Lemur catta TaxID=9447 RepID=UPI001E26A186|nr:uncharacterized protein LOC123623416 [Lemur catta]
MGELQSDHPEPRGVQRFRCPLCGREMRTQVILLRGSKVAAREVDGRGTDPLVNDSLWKLNSPETQVRRRQNSKRPGGWKYFSHSAVNGARFVTPPTTSADNRCRKAQDWSLKDFSDSAFWGNPLTPTRPWIGMGTDPTASRVPHPGNLPTEKITLLPNPGSSPPSQQTQLPGPVPTKLSLKPFLPNSRRDGFGEFLPSGTWRNLLQPPQP